MWGTCKSAISSSSDIMICDRNPNKRCNWGGRLEIEYNCMVHDFSRFALIAAHTLENLLFAARIPMDKIFAISTDRKENLQRLQSHKRHASNPMSDNSWHRRRRCSISWIRGRHDGRWFAQIHEHSEYLGVARAPCFLGVWLHNDTRCWHLRQ